MKYRSTSDTVHRFLLVFPRCKHMPSMKPLFLLAGRIAQSVGHLTRRSEVLGSIPGLATYSADSRGTVVSYWRKYVHEVLVNCLGCLSLPRKRVVRLTDPPDMTF